MKLLNVYVSEHPNNVRRLTGVVEYDDQTTEDYWFEVPNTYEPSMSGNPWLAILLPLAATIGEDLTIALPVDRALLLGAESVLRLWKYWRPELHRVALNVRLGTDPLVRPNAAASFFSAGVDSTFTVLRRPDVLNWITVHGFDMPIAKKAAFEQHCVRLSRIATTFGATFIPVTTNIRETKWKVAHWEMVAHGAALGAVALLFERHFNEVLIPASYDFSCLDPWGSHPLSDPLFSTSKTQLVHEGTAYTRTEKIEYLSNNEKAISELHVCYRGDDSHGQDERNCCRCEKCYRTMIALELFGKLDQAVLFDRSRFDIRRISKIFVSHALDEKFFLSLEKTAKERGRADIAGEISKCMRRSKRIKKLEILSSIPFAWRLGQGITKLMLRDSPK